MGLAGIGMLGENGSGVVGGGRSISGVGSDGSSG